MAMYTGGKHLKFKKMKLRYLSSRTTFLINNWVGTSPRVLKGKIDQWGHRDV